jgi:hypothetical protein
MRMFGAATRWICIGFLTLFGALATTTLALFVWEAKCDEPMDQAQRVLLPLVKFNETQELAKSGRLGDMDAALRSGPPPHVIGLEYYRVVVQSSPKGYDVAIKPTGWCFCRRTFMLRENGKRMETISSLTGRPVQ